MLVKICGTTNLADAELSLKLGVEALGFIFAPSRRRVDPEQVAAITAGLPRRVEHVGVFTEPDVDAIARVVQRAGLTAVQMHWPYRPGVVQHLRSLVGEAIRLWQVVAFPLEAAPASDREQEFTQQVAQALRDREIAVLLLDASQGQSSGGLGQAIPWARVGALLQPARGAAKAEAQPQGTNPPSVVLAGGLSATNVAAAIAQLRPDGVDVVSGVEGEPGKKDPGRLRAFVDAVRQAAPLHS